MRTTHLNLILIILEIISKMDDNYLSLNLTIYIVEINSKCSSYINLVHMYIIEYMYIYYEIKLNHLNLINYYSLSSTNLCIMSSNSS